jgi:hypothetical protein
LRKVSTQWHTKLYWNFGLKTISVIAGGLKHIYSPENKKLAEEILKNGELVSEFPLGVKATYQKFSYPEPCNQWFVQGNSSH